MCRSQLLLSSFCFWTSTPCTKIIRKLFVTKADLQMQDFVKRMWIWNFIVQMQNYVQWYTSASLNIKSGGTNNARYLIRSSCSQRVEDWNIYVCAEKISQGKSKATQKELPTKLVGFCWPSNEHDWWYKWYCQWQSSRKYTYCVATTKVLICCPLFSTGERMVNTYVEGIEIYSSYQ